MKLSIATKSLLFVLIIAFYSIGYSQSPTRTQLTYPLSPIIEPSAGFAVDASGNIYISSVKTMTEGSENVNFGAMYSGTLSNGSYVLNNFYTENNSDPFPYDCFNYGPIAVDSTKNIYIVANAPSRLCGNGVVFLAPNYESVQALNTNAESACLSTTTVSSPVNVAVSPDGNLLYFYCPGATNNANGSQTYNQTFYQLTRSVNSSGSYIWTQTSIISFPQISIAASYVNSMAADNNGNLYILVGGSQLLVWNNGTFKTPTTITSLDNSGPYNGFLAVGPNGDVFIGDRSNDRVIDMAPTGSSSAPYEQSTIASNLLRNNETWGDIDGIGVDANNNVYVIMDTSISGVEYETDVVELPAP